MITSSLREAFNKCHKKMHWSVINGLMSKGESTHLIAGAAYAKGLEAFRTQYYRIPEPERTAEYFEQCAAHGLVALLSSYGPHEPALDSAKTYDGTVSAYVEHLVRYTIPGDHAAPSLGPNGPRVEFSFAFEIPGAFHPVTNDPILFVGRCDQIVDYNGALFVFDDKTTSALGPLWSKQWNLRSQFTAYTYGAQQHQLPVIGAIIRGMSILKSKCDTAEAIVYRPRWMIDRWVERLQWDVQRMIAMWNSGYWPNTGEESGACSDYGGCPFQVLCESEHPDNYIPVYFAEGRWDPMHREVK
jgi:hypothetical protein